MYSKEGDFLGFFGSNRVEVTFQLLLDRFWKSLFSNENREKFSDYIPIEYTSFDLDKENFIYTVTQNSNSSENMIRKLNSLGINIIEQNLNNSFQQGFGDLNPIVLNRQLISTRFVDIAVDKNGYINALDFTRGRIFQYDQNANLMFVMGGIGNQMGNFITPTAIETLGQSIIVLDKSTNSITRLVPTEFGIKVHMAMELYNEGLYIESIEPWEEVLKFNSNYNLGYIGIGKAELELGNYQEAMEYFKIGKYLNGFNLAYKEYRTDKLRENFPYIFVVVILFLIFMGIRKTKLALMITKKIKEFFLKFRIIKFLNQKKKSLVEAMKIMLHPIEGYDDMFYRKYESKYIATFIAGLFFVSIVINR